MIGICIFLAAITWVVFGQTVHFGFVNLDDDLYVYNNPTVLGGLTPEGVLKVFTHAMCNFYHPLTMLSLMADEQIHGLNPGGFHITNVLIHTGSVIALFLVLRQMTGALWRSAFVAAVFAIHPLRAESVAWVSERKDVLGTFFFMLTLAAYVHYVRKPESLARYLMVPGLFLVDLLCKPAALALPFLLLLLDYWPLNRCVTEPSNNRFAVPKRLLIEKIPLFALVVLASIITYFAEGEAVANNSGIPTSLKITNIPISYVVYLRQMLYPASLTVFYPYPASGRYPIDELAMAFFLLTVITGAALLLWRKQPWLVVGWFWYLGMLLPAIGIVAVNPSAHGDRYSYLPQIGLYIILAWAIAEWSAQWKFREMILGIAMLASIAVLGIVTFRQTSYWESNEKLWPRVLAFDPANRLANYNLAVAQGKEGKTNDAILHYRKALEADPDYAPALNNLGNLLRRQGRIAEAIVQLRKAIKVKPDFADAHNDLGNALDVGGETNEAVEEYRRAEELERTNVNTLQNLGKALLRRGDFDEAMARFDKVYPSNAGAPHKWFELGNKFTQSGDFVEAVACYRHTVVLDPRFAEAWGQLGLAYFKKGASMEASNALGNSLELKPDQPQIESRLAWLMATSTNAAVRNGVRAVALAEEAKMSLGAGDPLVLGTLAAAYAEAGRFEDAVTTGQQAVEVAESQTNATLASALKEETNLYRAGKPMRGSE